MRDPLLNRSLENSPICPTGSQHRASSIQYREGRWGILVLNICLVSDTIVTVVELPGRELKYSWKITKAIVGNCSQSFSRSDKILILEGAEP